MNNPSLILVVDDEADFREIFSVKLTGAGFHVETATNGEEAIQKAASLAPSLILLDMQMPGLNGVDVLLALKKNPETAGIKVVFLTNLGDPRSTGDGAGSEEHFSREIGAAGYIKKTEDLDVLLERVKAFL